MSDALKVFIGFDPREADAYQVAEHTLRKHASIRLDVRPLVLEHLRWEGLYKRPTEIRDGRLWDVISAQPMSTEFNLTRFLVPQLAGYRGWALFFDCDFLFRADVAELVAYADEKHALMCVNHTYDPRDALKMDDQVVTRYPRKCWSSLMLWNCGHLLHAGQLERVNRWPRLWLHQLRWLGGWPEIGFLPKEWNWLEGVDDLAIAPKAVHYTRGIPRMPGYETSAYADEWRAALEEATHASGKAAP